MTTTDRLIQHLGAHSGQLWFVRVPPVAWFDFRAAGADCGFAMVWCSVNESFVGVADFVSEAEEARPLAFRDGARIWAAIQTRMEPETVFLSRSWAGRCGLDR